MSLNLCGAHIFTEQDPVKFKSGPAHMHTFRITSASYVRFNADLSSWGFYVLNE